MTTLLHALHLNCDRHPELVFAVLDGRVSIGELQDITAGSVDLEDIILGSRNAECHKAILAKCVQRALNEPPIDRACETIEELEAEVGTWSDSIRTVFVRGDLTLIQARYVHRKAYPQDWVERFVARAKHKRAKRSEIPDPPQPRHDNPKRRELLGKIEAHPAHGRAGVDPLPNAQTKYLERYVQGLHVTRPIIRD